jgi:hypothetical protein
MIYGTPLINAQTTRETSKWVIGGEVVRDQMVLGRLNETQIAKPG